ncbi:hypothetical protein STEG23_019955 [Scotinomys teguina]
MASPALPEVHLLRGPGDPAGHRQHESPQTRRNRAQICTRRPRPGPAHCRSQRQERVARGWDNGSRNQGPAGFLGSVETKPTKPTILDRTSIAAGGRKPILPQALAAFNLPYGRHPRSPQPSLRGRHAQRRPIGAGPQAKAVPPHKAAPTSRSATRRGASAASPARYRQRPAVPTSPGELEPGPPRRHTGSCSCC